MKVLYQILFLTPTFVLPPPKKNVAPPTFVFAFFTFVVQYKFALCLALVQCRAWRSGRAAIRRMRGSTMFSVEFSLYAYSRLNISSYHAMAICLSWWLDKGGNSLKTKFSICAFSKHNMSRSYCEVLR